VVFPAPLMTTIAEVGSFLAREQAAAGPQPPFAAGVPQPAANGSKPVSAAANGTAETG
jgi:hypothetical protein